MPFSSGRINEPLVYMYLTKLYNLGGWILYSFVGRGCIGWMIYEWLYCGALCHAWEYFTFVWGGGGSLG